MRNAQFTSRLTQLVGLLLISLWTVTAQVEGPNGHFYKVVMVPEGISWSAANLAAANSTFNGLHGYLATIT